MTSLFQKFLVCCDESRNCCWREIYDCRLLRRVSCCAVSASCERGNGEPGNRGICKRGHVETASITVFKLFLHEAAANGVHHMARSFCFHLWATSSNENENIPSICDQCIHEQQLTMDNQQRQRKRNKCVPKEIT